MQMPADATWWTRRAVCLRSTKELRMLVVSLRFFVSHFSWCCSCLTMQIIKLNLVIRRNRRTWKWISKGVKYYRHKYSIYRGIKKFQVSLLTCTAMQKYEERACRKNGIHEYQHIYKRNIEDFGLQPHFLWMNHGILLCLLWSVLHRWLFSFCLTIWSSMAPIFDDTLPHHFILLLRWLELMSYDSWTKRTSSFHIYIHRKLS